MKKVFLYWRDKLEGTLWEDPVDWIYIRCPCCASNLVPGKARSSFVHASHVTEYNCPECKGNYLFLTDRHTDREAIPFLLTNKLKSVYDERRARQIKSGDC